ncbi:autotransporter secretion outer membrane protein TamA [Luteimonas cucumeris]|uniref:Translocation and assembly module subunit TamA n=1 Tax=Luteimonas cucumeris TaxID=985012 RepID=A0A562KUQ1_9GAMM|nr:autotransporter assembly complex family protein [Luteimonas cucumeris]TWH99112.1 autotransporter secretion outer membrane protein TamA [Luteimonas cucumeris]
MRSPALVLAALLLFATAPVLARGTIEKVNIHGLDREDDAAMIENIESSLSLYDTIGKPQGEARLEYLINQAQRQTRQALEPFGFYSPTITVDAPRNGDNVTVNINVDKGQPVRIRRSDITITGEGEHDRYLREDLADFRPAPQEILDHAVYETSRNQISRRLSDRGYFDADLTRRQVSVTRAEYAADIDLAWDSGRRYDMGPITFHDDYFRPGLFDPLVYWEEGSYFHQGKLDRLRESLVKLDYFSSIDIQTHPEQAVDGLVPIDVNLVRAKRSIYTVGLSYGSESGAGVRLGLERRYVNRRGHKFNSQLDFAQNRKSFITQYRIPAFRWLDGWYAVAFTAYDEQTDYIDMRNVRTFASRSGEINEHLTAIASVNLLRERWNYGETDENGQRIYQYSTLFYPELRADYVDVDDRMFPRKGISANLTLRGGLEGAGSDTNFAQLHGTLRWFVGLDPNSRLLLRGEAGTTYTSDLVSMPPSLRFFAGGDRSIRGYAFREVGPRTPPPDNYALGAKHVATATVEYERYLDGSPWGGAVFVDTGSAFDDRMDLHTGIGIGLRWRSPVGPVRIDIARGLNDPDSAFEIYLNIGADL